nr:ribonuclease H-like domain, reverse transcriptase, RNA-dependent DNA polymerase [Tanacetum cinerariifolium]
MSDLGLLAYYLGIEFTQTNGDILIKQSAYASKILKEAGMLDCNETLIPMDPGKRLTKFTEGTMVNSTEYRSIIEYLSYLLHTRPDLSYSVGLLSRFMQEPREQHMKAIRQVLRYVKVTKDYGITDKHNGGNKIHGFSESSYGVNTQERKGTTDIIFHYGESPISWSTQKQATVALSSCESKFITATAVATQAIWLKRLLSKLTHSQEEKITIQIDNKSAIALMKNPISDNLLTGSIPASFKNFIRLDRLYLYSNYLTGTFPKDINLSKIRRFSVDSNRLSGSLPQVGELLESFTASDNYFSGPIPETIGNISSLRYLNLNDNMFHGTLPAVPVNIIAYSIKNNTMIGDLPSSICHSNLQVFHLSDNNITGENPKFFKKCSRLNSLNLNDNRLQGLVPRSLVNCRILEVIDLGKNMISDTFPTWLESLPQLQVLVLKSNRLYDAIETSSSEPPFNKLRILDLCRNLFTGLLPSMYFERFEGMMDIDGRPPVPVYMGWKTVYQDSVELIVKGRELKFERILNLLTAVDLSNNRFEGEIPRNIRMLNSLRYLNLSHNHLTGQIPIMLRNLTKLKSLDLSSNQLKGKIPSELTRLTFLAVFNVSSNQISRTIPQGGQFNHSITIHTKKTQHCVEFHCQDVETKKCQLYHCHRNIKVLRRSLMDLHGNLSFLDMVVRLYLA